MTFRYTQELDPKGVPQFGLIAEQVAEIDRELVERDGDREPYSVRYDAINAMLLNEFQKEHRKGLEHDRSIAQLKASLTQHEARSRREQNQLQTLIAEQQKQIEGLKSALQEQSRHFKEVRNQDWATE